MGENEIILGVGLDESNHGWDIKKKGEIVVATFSLYSQDFVVKPFVNRRDSKKFSNWTNKPYADYNFTILFKDEYRKTYSNLLEVAPCLIKNYIEKNLKEVGEIKIYLDGRLEKGGRGILREHFLGYKGIEKVVVDNFIKKNKNKKGKISKRPLCPALVYYADICANNLFAEPFQELVRNERFVVCEQKI